ncbi:MAG TPA: DinB family protein [Acidimicrobiales bacterium]|nr:DinB family protein [Acidimicrobiales bacterium]
MPGQTPPVADEREGLLAYLAQQRLVLRLSAYGLTDEQARQSPSVSPLSVGGLIKHVASVERYWIDIVVQRQIDTPDDYEANFRVEPGESLQSILDMYDAVARETEAVIDKVADLGQAVPVPKGVPWFPDDVDAWSVRWVLLHIITETARHAGHADIVRESVDGATAFPLMAAAEGWPASPWITPWRRPDTQTPA